MAAKADTKIKSEIANFIKLLSVFVAYDNDLELADRKYIQDYIYKCNDFLKQYSDAKTVKLLLQYIVRDIRGDKWLEASEKMGNVVKQTAEDIYNNSEVPNAYISILKDLGLYLRNQSEPAYKRIIKGISSLNDNNVNKMFIQKIDVKQDSQINQLKKIVKKLTGKEDVKIDAATAKKVKAKNEDLYKEYLKLRRETLETYKKTLANIIRSSGKPYLEVNKVLKLLKQKGIEVHTIPRGFEGFVGDDGSLYTTAGKHITGVPLGSVVMNPSYNPKTDNGYVFSSDGDGTFATSQRYYTDDYKQRARKVKYEKAQKFSGKLDTIRNKWLSALKRWTGDAISVAALMLEIAYRTSARIGGRGMTAGKATYGLSTWQPRHLTIKPNEITIKYQGKKGMNQKHIIKADDNISKLIIKHIKELVEDKDKKDFVFTDDKGRHVSAVVVNQYLKSLGSPVTVHKLRTAAGTSLMQTLLDNSKWKKKKEINDRELEKWVKEQAIQVGKKLGHQSTTPDGKTKIVGTTAINNYINPQVIKNFYDDLGKHYPRWLEKLKTEDDD